MRQRDWRRDGNQDDMAESTDRNDPGPEIDGPLPQEEMRQLLLQEAVCKAKAAELSQFRRFEQQGASDAEWRLLLMECSPTVH